MPDDGGHRARAALSAAVKVALLAALPVLAGCHQTGDLGRLEPNFFNTRVQPPIGKGSATGRGEPTSYLPVTDDERDLKNLAYVMVAAPDIYGWRQGKIPYARWHRIAPPNPHYDPVNAYHDRLVNMPFASEASRFNRLMGDLEKERKATLRFGRTAERVLLADRERAERLYSDAALDPARRAAAEDRIGENELLICLAMDSVQQRLHGYRYAIRHLYVETPSPLAVEAHRAYERTEASINEVDRRILPGLCGHYVGEASKSAPVVLAPRKPIYDPDSGAQAYSLARPR